MCVELYHGCYFDICVLGVSQSHPKIGEQVVSLLFFIWPALFAMGFITALVFLAKSNIKTIQFKKIVLIFLGTVVFFSIYQMVERKQVFLEVHNKGKVFDAIVDILVANPSANINNQMVIKVPEVSAIYQIKGTEIKTNMVVILLSIAMVLMSQLL